MRCNECGYTLSEGDKFCPACGAKYEPPKTEVYRSPDATRAYEAEKPTRYYDPESTRAYEPVDSGAGARVPDYEEDDHTMIIDGYGSPSQYGDGYAQDRYAESYFPETSLPSAYGKGQPTGPRSYDDSYTQQSQRYTSDGHPVDSRSSYPRYQPVSAGKRIASVVMCLLFMLFAFLSLVIASARIGLTESNVRKAYQKGSLADIKISTEQGEKELTDVFMENVVDAQTNQPIPLQRAEVESFLRSQNINNFAENLVTDFTGFFIYGKMPTMLNSREITKYLTTLSAEIKERIGYSMSDEDIAYIGKRIDGGDLSFLSIDENGGYFKTKYNFDPKLLSVGTSVPVLIILSALSALCIIMIFVINHGNTPSALSFSGTTMILFGVLNLLIAIAMLAMSFINPVFLISELTRGLAFAAGGISLVILIIGIIFSVIKTVLKNRIY